MKTNQLMDSIKKACNEAGLNFNNICEQYIYLIKNKNTKDIFKIGYSSNPKNRLHALNIGNHNDLELIFKIKIKNSKYLEQFLHNKYKNKLVRGEWFKLTKDDTQNIKHFLSNFKYKNVDKEFINFKLNMFRFERMFYIIDNNECIIENFIKSYDDKFKITSILYFYQPIGDNWYQSIYSNNILNNLGKLLIQIINKFIIQNINELYELLNNLFSKMQEYREKIINFLFITSYPQLKQTINNFKFN
jgi:hypothetical protein